MRPGKRWSLSASDSERVPRNVSVWPVGCSSSNGIDGAVLETDLAGTGAAFSEAASGAGAIQPSTAWAQARFQRRQTPGTPATGRRVELELRAGPGTAVVESDD